ncbi:hypothetical protein [Archangium primigenium]|uniref:hypothetical protein n=1 Tax=[Archangium] primigenium TaxID=2792470 RepID=UPI0019595409|nr:hypothetical protein [Archangium primigenium]MBM7117005.1 hypothetical protein [Archangium primigenium]
MRNRARGVVLGVLLAAGGASAQAVETDPYARPASVRSPVELPPDTGRQTPEELVGWLVKEEPAQRLEALLRLLPWADKLLPRLEQQARTARDDASRARLLEALRELTRHWVSLERLEAHPHLRAWMAAEVKRGLRLVEPWTRVTTTEALIAERRPPEGGGDETGPWATLLPEREDFARLRNELATLGGFARPAVDRLLESPSPEAKLHGFALAGLLDLHPRSKLFPRLREDTHAVEVESYQASDSPTRRDVRRHTERISERMLQLEERSEHVKKSPALGTRMSPDDAQERIVEVLSVLPRPGGEEKKARSRGPLLMELTHTLRQAGASGARDEQDCWNRIRPSWRAWWGRGGLWATQ